MRRWMAAAPTKATFSKVASESSADAPWCFGVITFIRPSIIATNSSRYTALCLHELTNARHVAKRKFKDGVRSGYFFPPLFLMKPTQIPSVEAFSEGPLHTSYVVAGGSYPERAV